MDMLILEKESDKTKTFTIKETVDNINMNSSIKVSREKPTADTKYLLLIGPFQGIYYKLFYSFSFVCY